jgi:flavin-dependent dehydrogenase
VSDSSQPEVAIVGASFAGLACARELAGRRVTVIDRYPVGDHETSACAAPRSVVRFLGAEDAIVGEQHSVAIYVTARRAEVPLSEPYVTFDYRRLCELVWAQCDAELVEARVEGRDGTGDPAILLADGRRLVARQLVDAGGWRRTLDRRGRLSSSSPGLSYGAEEHVDFPEALPAEGLHVYVHPSIVSPGYGWNFPTNGHARLGVGAFRRVPLQPGLAAVRARDGAGPAQSKQGGVIPHLLREPVTDGVLFAGDAAGHCLPLTAEGIRGAVWFGALAGRLLRAVAEGRLDAATAHGRYRAAHEDVAGHFGHLLTMQRAYPRLGVRGLASVARIVGTPRIGRAVTRRYLRYLRPEELPAV